MAYHAPTYRELYEVVHDYLTENGYKPGFLTDDEQPYDEPLLEESDLPELVSRLARYLESRSNNNVYFVDDRVNSEFLGLKSFLDMMEPHSAALFLKAVKLISGLALKGHRKDVSV